MRDRVLETGSGVFKVDCAHLEMRAPFYTLADSEFSADAASV